MKPDFLSNNTMAQAKISSAVEKGITLDEYELEDDSHPAVYVGTYAKYNAGSLFGMWFDLLAFDSHDEFIAACRLLHKDERDPELMFQDYQNFPRKWYDESEMDEETFDKIHEMYNLDDEMAEAYFYYIDNYLGEDIDGFKDRFKGKYDSEVDFAEEIVNDCYDLDRLMGNLSFYFDYERFARDLFLDGYTFIDGYVFSDF